MSILAHRAAPQSRPRFAPIATVAILFWLFSYALFTSRVQLRGDEGVAALFTLRRLLTTAAGALIYAAVLRFAIFPTGRQPAHPLVLVAAVIPAAAAMVAIRVIVDPLVSAEPLPLANHLRWVLVWAGYFGLWVIAFTAWRMHAERADSAPAVHRSGAAAAGDPSGFTKLSRTELQQLVEAIALETARLPEAERRALLARPGTGYAPGYAPDYAEADDPLGTANMRGAIMGRIARGIMA